MYSTSDESLNLLYELGPDWLKEKLSGFNVFINKFKQHSIQIVGDESECDKAEDAIEAISYVSLHNLKFCHKCIQVKSI